MRGARGGRARVGPGPRRRLGRVHDRAVAAADGGTGRPRPRRGGAARRRGAHPVPRDPPRAAEPARGGQRGRHRRGRARSRRRPDPPGTDLVSHRRRRPARAGARARRAGRRARDARGRRPDRARGAPGRGRARGGAGHRLRRRRADARARRRRRWRPAVTCRSSAWAAGPSRCASAPCRSRRRSSCRTGARAPSSRTWSRSRVPGPIHVDVERVRLADVPAAYERLEAGAVRGRLVAVPQAGVRS